MSTTTATSYQKPAKAPRRLGKKQLATEMLEGSVSDVGAPTEYQKNTSPATAAVTKNNNKGQLRKPLHANKKSQSEGAPLNGAKQSNNRNHQDKAKATPVKSSAYAASNFQQSPAASDLPLPSFYSKSLPGTSLLSSEVDSGDTSSPQIPSVASVDESPSKRESTPCDFLFEAARHAKATPQKDSPAIRSGNLNIPNGSPASRSPAPREADSMFPFELEGGTIPGEDGSPFATPYKDRMEALRSSKAISPGSKSMDENERKAKSDALKQLLMRSSGQVVGTGVDPRVDMNNPFNARAPYQQPPFSAPGPPLARQVPGPPLSVYMQEHPGYIPPHHLPPAPYQYSSAPSQAQKRPTSSRLRNVYGAQSEPEYAELSSDSAVTPPISTARRHTGRPVSQYNSMGQQYPSQPQMPSHPAKPSAQQLEDDLRRVLKLDLTSRG
ncbi:hypothetical protein A1O3_08267 [Capronia epimyces CBS 606.96]|uniref:Uncharacterized protein n=1 Tax=Capronia epimyces CBS 606.96 TaxID=1182542 RepID=W9XSN2_9EURO|nr:uncharacterized protein A1O3_08267 [Capronia epimyces CBS 606.96]EXJ79981.1 hypothetical protein A1O3_08267 [Capronia epimyces CBS 606.96]